MNEVSTEPLTVVVSRRVKKGKERAFEQLSSQMTERAANFPGHLLATMFRPSSEDDPEYRIVFKFRDRDTLTAWEESEESAGLLAGALSGGDPGICPVRRPVDESANVAQDNDCHDRSHAFDDLCPDATNDPLVFVLAVSRK